MKILAIDPGHTTGWAIICNDQPVIMGAVNHFYTADFILHLVNYAGPDVIVIEDIPATHVDKLTRNLFVTLCANQDSWLAQNIPTMIVKPGQWKPLRSKVDNKTFAPHVADAIGLGLFVAQRIEQ